MDTSCQQLSDQMIDLLYGELPAGDRAAVDAHLAGCQRCRGELEAFRQTRALVRETLEEPVPARAHAEILRLAAAQAGAGAAAPSAAGGETRGKSARAPRRPFGDWIRTRWALPTLATVGALAVFLLSSRLFFDPQKTLERGRAGLLPAEAPAPESTPVAAPAQAPVPAPALELGLSGKKSRARPATAAAPALGADQPARAVHELYKAEASAHAQRKAPTGSQGKGGAASAAAAEPIGAAVEGNEMRRDEDGFAGRKREFAPPPPPRPKADAPGRSGGGAAPDDLAALRAPATAAKAKRLSRRGGDLDSEEKEMAEGDESPPAASGSASAAPEPTPAPPASAPARARARAAAPPPSPPPSPSSPAGGLAAAPPASEDEAGSEREVTKLRRAPPAPAAPPADAPAPSRDKAAPAPKPETLIQRADRLFSEHRWIEAAVAYRDLLRQDSRNPDAPRWRQRLSAAQAASSPPRP